MWKKENIFKINGDGDDGDKACGLPMCKKYSELSGDSSKTELTTIVYLVH